MILEVLQHVLGELFVEVPEQNVSFYHGDLFEPSHFKLSDVFLKTSLVNALQLPFELAAGYVGHVKVEGLLGAVAGWPLDVTINDMCLVLRPKQVDWGNELLLRYAKELVIAIWQSFLTPKTGTTSVMSPVKWISSRIKAAGTDMTIQLERIHFRVESEHNGALVAYGLNTPLIRFAPRELDEQILHRRQQPGVVYPKSSDGVTSKLLTLENASLYADLNAEAFWVQLSDAQAEAAVTDNESPPLDVHDSLANFRDHARKPFTRDPRRELIFVRVVWIKLELGRKPEESWPVLAAFDIVTEEIELKFDFSQIAAILAELEHVLTHLKRSRMLRYRPSCIDRDRQEPPTVELSTNCLLPVSEDLVKLTFTGDKQCKSKLWFREMWWYAFRCVLEQHQTKGKNVTNEMRSKQWWHQSGNGSDKEAKKLLKERRQRYIHLYVRRMSPAALEIVLVGRGKHLLGLSPYQTNCSSSSQLGKGFSSQLYQLPELEPLNLEEQWEFSDFILAMSVCEQRVCRALAEKELRRDFSAAPPSPVRKLSLSMDFSVTPSPKAQSPRHTRSYSVDSTSTPLTSLSASISPGFASDQCQYLARGATIGPGNMLPIPVDSPPSPRPHAASISILPSPTKSSSAQGIDSLREWVNSQRDLGLLTEGWLEKQCFPAWLINPSRNIPLINWQIGPVTVRFSEGDSVQSDSSQRSAYIELGIGSCRGAMLLSRKPVMRLLVELRVGLFHITLVSRPRFGDNEGDSSGTITEYKWISGDFIRTPEDGFFYIGLKYSGHEVTTKSTGRVHFVGYTDDEWSLKGRICIGPLTINCNEAAISKILGQSLASEMNLSGGDLFTPTHFSVFSDTYRSFHRLIALLPKRTRLKEEPVVKGSNTAAKPITNSTAEKHPPKHAKMVQLMHVLLLRSSTFEVEVGPLELNVSAFTSHINQSSQKLPTGTDMHESREEIDVTIPTTKYRLQNRPAMNECLVDIAGAQVVYRSTKQGRAAVIRHLAQIFKL